MNEDLRAARGILIGMCLGGLTWLIILAILWGTGVWTILGHRAAEMIAGPS